MVRLTIHLQPYHRAFLLRPGQTVGGVVALLVKQARAAWRAERKQRLMGHLLDRAALVRQWEGRLRGMARRFAGAGQSADDLYAVAVQGLYEALERCDPERADHFPGLARAHIRKALQRWVRHSEHIVIESEHEIRTHKAQGTARRPSEWAELED